MRPYPLAGHSTANINVSDVLGRNVDLVNPVQGFAALRVTGDTSGIDIQGSIIGGTESPGRGLQAETCQQCKFAFARNSAADYQLLVGKHSAGVCSGSIIAFPGIIYDGNGAENTPPGGGATNLTKCLDPSLTVPVQSPTRMTLPP